MDKEQIVAHFTNIYHSNYWNGLESKSGTGSDIATTATLRPHLVNLLNDMEFKTMVDAPCGDFFWMKEIIEELEIEEYHGYDIVEEMISAVRDTYGETEKGPKRSFETLNVVEEILPKVDVIFSRDCLVHFSYATARKILQNYIESGSEYILMTTFLRDDRAYSDISDGQWHPINFQMEPFNLPEPERLIIEGCIEDRYRWTDKALGLWKLDNLKGIV